MIERRAKPRDEKLRTGRQCPACKQWVPAGCSTSDDDRCDKCWILERALERAQPPEVR